MKRLLLSSLPVVCLLAGVLAAGEKGASDAETAGGWVKYEKNPVLGGSLGTCFDVSVLREGDRYRMWFSWRPKQSIALVESKDGLTWSEPTIVLGPNKASGWEDDLNRPVVIMQGGKYRMWYTGQVKGKSWIGYATSQPGRPESECHDSQVDSPCLEFGVRPANCTSPWAGHPCSWTDSPWSLRPTGAVRSSAPATAGRQSAGLATTTPSSWSAGPS